jgi:hypothetical protein
MDKTVLLALSVVCVAASLAAGQAIEPYIEIDGSKNPEQIPAWVTWETAFRALALAERSQSKAVPQSLQMSDEDRRLVFTAAKAQAGRDAVCEKKVEGLRPMLGKIDDSVINERTREIQLECRQASLDAADALMEALTAEGQTSMEAWLQTLKHGIHARVPKSELDHYRRPY